MEVAVSVHFEGDVVVYVTTDNDKNAEALALETVRDAIEMAFNIPDGWIAPLGSMEGVDLLDDLVVKRIQSV